MSIYHSVIKSFSLYQQWSQQNQDEWMSICKISFIKFYCLKRFYIVGLCVFFGLQITTWSGLSYSEFRGIQALLVHSSIAIVLSASFAFLARYFTQLSFEQHRRN